MQKTKKARKFSIQTSYDYAIHTVNGNGDVVSVENPPTEEDWKKDVIEKLMSLDPKNVAYIFHGQDVLEDGSPKPLHLHAIVDFANPRSATAIMKNMGITRPQNVDHIRSMAHAFRYLTHVTDAAINDAKHIYSESEVVVAGQDWEELGYHMLKVAKKSKEKKTYPDNRTLEEYQYHIRNMVYEGELGYKSLHEYIRKDINDDMLAEKAWSKCKNDWADAFNERLKRKYDLINSGMIERNLVTGYIGGKGGSGKSSLAQWLANIFVGEGETPHKVPVQAGKDTTFDFAGDYEGETASIADDFDPNMIDTRPLLGLIDPNHASPTSSRNHDKVWLANNFIVTHSSDFEDWVASNMLYSKGGSKYAKTQMGIDDDLEIDWCKDKTITDRWQLQRRFGWFIKVVRNKKNPKNSSCSDAYVYVFDRKRHGYWYGAPITCINVTRPRLQYDWAKHVRRQINDILNLLRQEERFNSDHMTKSNFDFEYLFNSSTGHETAVELYKKRAEDKKIKEDPFDPLANFAKNTNLDPFGIDKDMPKTYSIDVERDDYPNLYM